MGNPGLCEVAEQFACAWQWANVSGVPLVRLSVQATQAIDVLTD